MGIKSFADELEEMMIFLYAHQDQLFSVEGYEETKLLGTKLYNEQRGYDSLSNGLVSDDQTQFILN